MPRPDIPFARPFIGKEEEEAVLRVLRSGWLTTGSEALAFEKEFAAFLSPAPGGSPSNKSLSVNNKPTNAAGDLFCLAVNSATSGLHLALEACGVGQGDIVLVPSCTFTATAEVARYLGADPVFVDVTPGTFHIDPNALEDTIKRLPIGKAGGKTGGKAKAVIPVHYGGLPCDMAAIMDIARRHNLKVIEDAAHAFPSVLGIGDRGSGVREVGGKYPPSLQPAYGGLPLPPSAGVPENKHSVKLCSFDEGGTARAQEIDAVCYKGGLALASPAGDTPATPPYSEPHSLLPIGPRHSSTAGEFVGPLAVPHFSSTPYAPAMAHNSASPLFSGTIGDAGVFSFYATKTITTGEGGMVVCRDGEMARRISLMRSHGIDRTIWNRYSDTRASWQYEVVEAGYKYNMPDLLAAIGRAQLSRAWELLRQREEMAAVYDAAFAGDERFILPPTGPGDARHLYPLRLNPLKAAVSRDTCIEKLKEAGIGVSVHFIPLHTMPYYKNRYSLEETDFPETMKSCKQEISLPIWPGMTMPQVHRVIDEIKKICKNHDYV